MRSQKLQLFFLGAAILYWELIFIRWAGAAIRIVAYFSNFILISVFFGLGVGSLLAARKIDFSKYLLPMVCLYLVICPVLGSCFHPNPGVSDEYIWLGTPLSENLRFLGQTVNVQLPYWSLLLIAFLFNSAVFAIFGQWLGRLFTKFEPLTAYTIEVAGGILGIAAFGLVSYFGLSPTYWIVIGMLGLLGLLDLNKNRAIVYACCLIVSLPFVYAFENQFIWSPYYKISIQPFDTIYDAAQKNYFNFHRTIGYSVTVNNDYHQQILDLRKTDNDHAFIKAHRASYDAPHANDLNDVDGPVLIIGAGTGNDVSAAVRGSHRQIDAVEIDPSIIKLGQQFHPEQPYQNSRVTIINTDARSYLNRTNKRYAKIIFGFLDSHTLMSTFSSLRLDNFVYTRESLARAKELLLPGGRIFLSFSTQTQFINDHIVALLNEVFDEPTHLQLAPDIYSNGYVYSNIKNIQNSSQKPASTIVDTIPTDDWPFLYLKSPSVPDHYIVFLTIVIGLSLLSLLILPKGQRIIRLPFFFLGAGFFLIEASNVVRLSLLYGSTWTVNILIFSGILILVSFGNVICLRFKKIPQLFIGIGLFVTCAVSYFVDPAVLLDQNLFVQAVMAVLVYLSPVLFASMLFAQMIKTEKSLYAAYGSNLIGAMFGGAAEYLSLIYGFRFLTLVAAGFYALALLFYVTGQRKG